MRLVVKFCRGNDTKLYLFFLISHYYYHDNSDHLFLPNPFLLNNFLTHFFYMLPPTHPMKTSENQWLSDLFKGYEKEILTRNGYDIYKQILLWLYN